MIFLDEIKSKILTFLKNSGYELSKIEYMTKAERAKTQWLENLGIKTVLDIGANEGQFAKYIHNILPDARIYSFEPLRDCYEKLNANFESLNKFKAFNVALGDKNEEQIIHRSNFSQSSSLLPMLTLHEESFPSTIGGWQEKIQVARLDNLKNELILESPLLIKIDVQGFEDKVIDGGFNVISQATVLIIELSMEPLYDGQLLFDKMYLKVKSLGFKYQGNLTQLHSAADGKIVQVDGVFVKN